MRRGAIAVLMGIVGAGIVLGTMLGSNAAQTLASAVAPGITVTYPAGLGAVAQVAATPDTTADDTPADTTVEDTTVTEEAPLAEAPVAETPAPAAAPAPTTTTTETTPEEPTTPPVKHVWVVMLADQNLAKAAKDTQTAPYLAGTLAPQGTLLTGYHAVAHGSLPNSIALLSGQGPAPATQADCPVYADVTPADAGDDGQELGDGCLYSVQTGTIGDELRQSELGWKSYVESMGTACRHPKAGVKDPDHTASASSPYVTWRNPFVSFHTELDGDTCAAEDVDLAKLDADLAAGADAPAFSYVVPDRCHDGSAEPCRRGAPAGTAAADAWLKEIVPKILASKAYADDGLLVVTADQAPATGASADSSGCCRPGTYPNTKDAGAPGPSGAGGGVVGALLVSGVETVWSGVEIPAYGDRITRKDYRGRGIALERFAEMARFNYGSTVIVLLPPGVAALDPGLRAEQSVRLGQRLGLLS